MTINDIELESYTRECHANDGLIDMLTREGRRTALKECFKRIAKNAQSAHDYLELLERFPK